MENKKKEGRYKKEEIKRNNLFAFIYFLVGAGLSLFGFFGRFFIITIFGLFLMALAFFLVKRGKEIKNKNGNLFK